MSTTICDECDGKGFVARPEYDYIEGREIMTGYQCEKCDGLGELEDE